MRIVTTRTVLCHYHIFKNSGSTFERILSKNYGNLHLTFDGPFQFSQVCQEELTKIIDHHPEIRALSSHQIYLPAPTSVRYRAIPVVFIRHPILRIRSVFLFEQRQTVTSENRRCREPLEAFEKWISERLHGHKNTLQLNNLQTSMLARSARSLPVGEKRSGRIVYDMQLAINNLSVVPCIGRTEQFENDVKGFENILADYQHPFKYMTVDAENVTSGDHNQPIETQLSSIENSLSKKIWEKLQWLNHQDIELYEVATKMVEERLSSGIHPLIAKAVT